MSAIYTVGHSTHDAAEFGELLAAYQIECLVDVRQFPGSRRYPHFGSRPLAEFLGQIRIEYRHEVDLGGRRRAAAESHNHYWHHKSFRAFADYMASDQFRSALGRLIALAAVRRTVIMCAEAVPWRCHRWLVADALVARGVEVIHILDAKHSQPHVINPHARVSAQGILTYELSPAMAADAERTVE